MKTLYEIVSELAAESSTNKKTEILIRYRDNALLREAFFMALDPFTNYFITAKTPSVSGVVELTLGTLIDVKARLAGRQVTGHAARDYLNYIMEQLTSQDQEMLKRIINHDMECKVAGSLVNRAWPDLISKFPVMLSEAFDDTTADAIVESQDGIIVQLKADGGRVQFVVSDDGGVTAYSRNGNILLTHEAFDDVFSSHSGKVFDGELLVNTASGVADRKTGNGLFNHEEFVNISLDELETELCQINKLLAL